MDILASALGIVGKLVAKPAADSALRRERVIQALKTLHLDPHVPPQDFDSLYAYTLVEYCANRPESVLAVFRDQYVLAAFRRSFDTADGRQGLRKEVMGAVERNRETGEFGHLDHGFVDMHADGFARAFQGLVDRSRAPHETRLEQKVDVLLAQARRTRDEEDNYRARAVSRRAELSLAEPAGPGGEGAPVLPAHVAQLLAAQQDICSDLPYELFGADAPPLGDVYVRERVRAVDPDARTGSSRPGPSVVVPASDLVMRRPVAVVLGAPGSGKTSMVQRLVQRWSGVWLSGDSHVPRHPGTPWLVPVRIAAADLTGDGTFPTLLTAALARQLGGRADFVLDPATFTERPAPGAEWLVCVDGLDEILDVGLRRKVVHALRWRLVNRGGHRFLITSRPLFLSDVRPLYESGAADCDLLPFDNDQLTSFAQRWFIARSRPELTPEFLAEIRNSPFRDDLTHVPLLATIAAVVHENNSEARLPMTRTGLFAQFIRYLLYVRPAAVQSRHRLVTALAPYGKDAEVLADWLYSNRRPLLAHIAAEHLSHDDTDLTAAADTWTRTHAPAVPDGIPLSEHILPTLLTSTGLITATAHGRPRFTHRSLAEFLAAPVLARKLGSDLSRLDDAACFLQSDHADYERLVLTLASWASAPGNQSELLWRRLREDSAWQALLAGRVAVETGQRVPDVASRLIRQLGLRMLTDRQYGPAWDDTIGLLGQLMHHPDVASEVRALAEEPVVHPARRTAALALLARHCGDNIAVDRIEALGRRSSAFAALCAADALIDAGSTDRGLRLLKTVLRHADLPGGWIHQAGLRLRKAGHVEDTVRLWKQWLSGRTPSDLATHNLIADLAKDLAESGESLFARQVAQRLVRNSGARLDARVFAAWFLVDSYDSERTTFDYLAEEGRRFLRDTIDDSAQETNHIVWIAEGMVKRGPDREAAVSRLRLVRDAQRTSAGNRFRAARVVAACSTDDRDTAQALLATLPTDIDQSDGAWWQAALLADALEMNAEATRFRTRAAEQVNDSSAIRTIVERLGDSDPLAARAEILDVAARTSDDGVHYETVRLLLSSGWIGEACDHAFRHGREPGIAPFWRNAVVGMTITAQPTDAALQLAAALAEVSDPSDPCDDFWSRTWAELSEDLQPLEDVMARGERWPSAESAKKGT
ncbi:NACHT domain-containing protein [Streptomyces atratus]|uniref:NACHT domain-containing protein n=1 Tax=Streptomyces atratus TaxID=1893 RepID=UPI0033EBE686